MSLQLWGKLSASTSWSCGNERRCSNPDKSYSMHCTDITSPITLTIRPHPPLSKPIMNPHPCSDPFPSPTSPQAPSTFPLVEPRPLCCTCRSRPTSVLLTLYTESLEHLLLVHKLCTTQIASSLPPESSPSSLSGLSFSMPPPD